MIFKFSAIVDTALLKGSVQDWIKVWNLVYVRAIAVGCGVITLISLMYCVNCVENSGRDANKYQKRPVEEEILVERQD